MDYKLKGWLYDNPNIEELYNSYGAKLGEYLRGDFYLELFISDNEIIRISDFGGAYCAGVFPRNTTMVFKDGNPIESFPTHNTTRWGYYEPPQGLRVTYEDCGDLFAAIDNAIAIRSENGAVIPLSSGHDSGCIAAGCDNQYDTITFVGNENYIVLDERLSLVPGDIKVFNYHTLEHKSQLQDTYGTSNSHYLVAKECEGKVILSGLGADEFYVNGDLDLMNEFLTESMKHYNQFDCNIRFPLLDPLVYKAWSLLKGKIKQGHKQPFEEYIKHKQYPAATKDKVGFYIFDDYLK